jgi:hypothetical protein
MCQKIQEDLLVNDDDATDPDDEETAFTDDEQVAAYLPW